MPVYEYLCPHCENKFERLRPMSDGLQSRCPDCGTEAPRVLSMFAAFARGSAGEVSPVAGSGCAGGGSCGRSCGGSCAGGS